MQFLIKSVPRLDRIKFTQFAVSFSPKSTNQMNKNSKMPRLPDRWTEYVNCGKQIEGTRIISFKTPLRSSYFQPNEPPGFRWGIKELVQTIPNLGLVVDLTFSTKYYDPSELTCRDIDHQKILCEGHVIPRPPVVKKFIDTIDEFLECNRDNDKLIGVHCTHGLNRTGYLVCRYMIDRMLFDRITAIDLFNAARGHQMERVNYVNHLKDSKDLQNTPRPDERVDRNFRESGTGSRQSFAVVAGPSSGKINVYFNPGPGRNSGYPVPRPEQNSRDSNVIIGHNDAYSGRAYQNNAFSERQGQNEGDFDTRLNQNSGHIRTGSGRFGDHPRSKSGQKIYGNRTGYNSREFNSRQYRHESNEAGLEEDSRHFRRGREQDRKGKTGRPSTTRTDCNWRDRD